MFFLNQENGDSKQVPAKKAPNAKANGNASPVKNKMAGGKVLRNKTRSAAQEELVQSTVAKITEHQRELHTRLQSGGLAKYSEGGGGGGRNEGKGWKRFQSYKGEVALPKEAEGLRVSPARSDAIARDWMWEPHRSTSTRRRRRLFCLSTALRCRSISTP